MEKQIDKSESVAILLSNLWFDEGFLLPVAFLHRIGESYISVNRPIVDSYDRDVESFLSCKPDFCYLHRMYRRAMLNVGEISDIKIEVGDTMTFADVEIEPRTDYKLSHAGIFVRYKNLNLKRGKKIKIASLKEEVSVDPILLEFRTELLERANVEVIKRIIDNP